MPHLLVTNDFPPKHGGIQSYLWELWRRLPPDATTVLTTPYAGAAAWDAQQPFRVERTSQRVLLPTSGLARQINELASEVDASIVMLDPALPLGAIGAKLDRPYGVVLHGAEVTVPRRLPGIQRALRRVLRGAGLVIAAGPYPAREGDRAAAVSLPTVDVPPGVDLERFRPLDAAARAAARRTFGLPEDATLVVSVSRLVPRKGMDTLIKAVARLAPARPNLVAAIGGAGRDRRRLDRLVATSGAPVRLLGRVDDDDLPALYGCADVFAMLCRNRWAGLEQEGFGIVFVEAAAAGVPQVAGDSGGAADAVVDGETGIVVHHPLDVAEATAALARLVDDVSLRGEMGAAGRRRVERDLSYDTLAARLQQALAAWDGRMAA
jgi:phosphatidylinositol alpha-1,6-mannosyltransferase